MEEWKTRGVPSSYGHAQALAVVGHLQAGSTGLSSSRGEFDHLHARLFRLLNHARTSTPTRTDRIESSLSSAELLEEINSLG